MRVNLWLFILIPLSVAAIFGLLELARPLPDPAQSIHVQEAQLFTGAFRDPQELSGATGSVTLPHDWRRTDNTSRAGELWYRIRVPLQVPPNRLWSVLLPEVEENAEIYLNGAIAGRLGQMSEYPSRYSTRALYFTLPNGLLRSGENLLDIRVKTYPPGQGYLGVIVLGPDDVLRPFYERKVFIKSDLLWFFVAASLVMTGIIAALAWQRPGESVYRWFTAQSALWSLSTAVAVTVDPPVNGVWLLTITGVASTWFCATCFFFALRFIDVRKPLLEKIILICAFAGTLFNLAAALITPAWLHVVVPYSTLVQMALGPFVLAAQIKVFWQTRDPELFLMLYAAGIVVFFGFFSMSATSGLSSNVSGLYLFYATPVILLAIVIMLLRRFIFALEQSESLNRSLEERIASKSKELELNYQRISAYEKEQSLISERERIMRDMHDGVGGHLVASLMQLKSKQDGSAAAADAGPDVAANLQKALNDLRMMIDSLEIGEGDLNVALGMLRRRMQEFLQASGVELQWEVQDIPAVAGLNPHAVLQIMRIVQEAITNAVRHAGARTIRLAAATRGPMICIRVEDDGIGFNVDSNTPGHGLRNMQHRSNDIGAELGISSGTRGTRISLTINTAGTLNP